jgi:hypothetical protein
MPRPSARRSIMTDAQYAGMPPSPGSMSMKPNKDVFTLVEAQEGKLFGPLAFTKTYSMAAAVGLSVTLIPVLNTGRAQQSPQSSADRDLSASA